MSVEEHRDRILEKRIRVGILTCSDTRTPRTDSSGAFIRDTIMDAGHEIVIQQIIKDDVVAVSAMIDECLQSGTDVLLITGGTGISRRDVTFDAVKNRLEKVLPGFGELFRSLSYAEIGAAAMLSRAIAGSIGPMTVFSMPGSTPAVRLAMEKLIAPELKHLVTELNR